MHAELEPSGDRWQLRFVRHLPHPPDKVWRAITEPEHLAAWFPTTIDGDRTEGAKLRFRFPDDEAPPFDGEMITFAPPSRLELRWGDDGLRIDLRAEGDGTELTLVDTFADLGKAARDAAGWHVCLDVLEAHLDGDDRRDELGSRWKPLNEEYIERFGPEAGTIGPPEGLG